MLFVEHGGFFVGNETRCLDYLEERAFEVLRISFGAHHVHSRRWRSVRFKRRYLPDTRRRSPDWVSVGK